MHSSLRNGDSVAAPPRQVSLGHGAYDLPPQGFEVTLEMNE